VVAVKTLRTGLGMRTHGRIKMLDFYVCKIVYSQI